ncbi:hypothetical protein EXE10_09145 [Acinetobacter sp. WCHAc060033]|uniref:hypothetical protein n=1 Tax=Acinetobacter sp. WCHAc060033 TaxID=2518624 RepID=UPI001022C7E4|nr:hypothetical protein [Acinetobacter sp. WCHAc060033]RZG85691.1 hypothetical protein EXE10_09145 [Acinetobacter sp. WCHAc060033]
MKNIVSKLMVSSLLTCVALSTAHAEEENASKAEVKKQIQVCAKKKEGDWVTYANKGVTYNGACLPNESGKLQFSFPAPAGGSSAAVAPPAADDAIANKPAVEAVPATQPAPAAAPEAPVEQSAPQASEQPATDAPAPPSAQ